MKDQLTISELQSLIIEWARQKNLNDPDKQYLKILEEIGETARAILKNDVPEIKDGIGDIAVTIIIFYWQESQGLVSDLWNWTGQLEAQERDYFEDLLKAVLDFNVDALDYLQAIALKQNTTLQECLNLAWNVIKDRKGKTVAGTFIKA